jgi:hypothetical protein
LHRRASDLRRPRGKVGSTKVGRFLPPGNLYDAVPRVNRRNHPGAVLGGPRGNLIGIPGKNGAHYGVIDAEVHRRRQGVATANPAAEFQNTRYGPANAGDRLPIGPTPRGGVQIDKVNPTRPGGDKLLRHRHRVLVVYSCLRVRPLAETYAVAIDQVDRRYYDHWNLAVIVITQRSGDNHTE